VFTIIQDTREKHPWSFASDHPVIKSKLDVGDYSVEGLEYILCIERKKSVNEFANNIVDDRFTRELDRMDAYKYKFLVFEFSIDDILKYPIGSDIPKKLWSKLRVNGKYMMMYISNLQVKRNIHVIFAGDSDNATYTAYNIMKRVYENN
jgi:ERCC4-type nuclease